MKKLLILLALVIGCVMPALAAEDLPKDAIWTIYCRSFAGPMRVQEAKRIKDALVKSSGMKNWHVIHLNEESTLYYGFYKAVSLDVDEGSLKKDAQRAQDDLQKIKSLKDADGNNYFPMVGFVPLPQPGSEGPPEWDLRNVPPQMYWTLYVGVYKGNPERKKAAVEAVRVLRADGIEAYYYHDTTASLICIGAWPRHAIKEQQSAEASVGVRDRDVEIMALNVPVPENVPPEFMTPDGKRVRVFAPRIDIQDRSLQSAIDRYPDFLTNGKWLGREVRDPKTGKVNLIGHKSQLLMIPRPEGKSTDQQRAIQRAAEHLLPRPTATPPGGGRLRSLED